MNGIILNEGLPIINVPAKRKLEFNEKMIHYYETDDSLPMIMFLRTCLNKRIAEEFSINW